MHLVQSAKPSVNTASPVLIEARGVAKTFNGVPALRDGRLQVRGGSVHALCGGNGAGKSTFLNIIMGVLRRDAGHVYVNGQEVDFHSPAEALEHGVVMISQELLPIPAMSVAENLYLGREPRRGGIFIDHHKMSRDAAQLLADLEFDVPVNARMEELSLAQIQLVEIAKALSRDAGIIIMDEPTSAIGEHEAHILFKAIRKLQANGSAIVYVSHKLTEIFEIADEYTIFRDGLFIESGKIADIDRKHLVTLIVGHELEPQLAVQQGKAGRLVLQVRGLSRRGWFEDISLDVASGEIVGIYGLLGSGRTEFLETVFGLHKPDSGEVLLEGKTLLPGNPKASIHAGMTMVPEDRKQTGLVLNSSIAHNITLSAISRLSVRGFIKRRSVSTIVDRMIGAQRIKCSSPDIAVESLSGGNQQKVVIARCLTTQPTLLICDEPTRGIDEGAKQEIYRFLREFVAQGNAVLLVSSEAPEVLQVSDRIAIFKSGKLHGVVEASRATQQQIMNLAA
ncbi:sugar ABC transporter ATP-binding protein [Rhizobium leguminosarum]|uniref:sugar ABC transporter ATP-binding protein n=1 Tax=Rhizobium leguminosarum TaxID=384 RepID=UPI00143F7AF8|nr:sugar ABC transporter ATP-binding protein [Rhizobium leguminosarum]NKL21216.1 ATP-binding cassette domain-containing protein [Rhizobium leguminosarum bv. viciae]NKL56919.1 ATP-binding cassette domain-containing protein [Rhizobium leguminosarum bv. viciae]